MNSNSLSVLARYASVLIMAVLLVVGCSDDRSIPPAPEPATTGTFTGIPRSIGNGTVQTWAELDEGVPVRIGITLTEEALSGLPTSVQWLSIPFPGEAQAMTLFNHVLFGWNPHGHFPAGVYTVPHFDFHFYTIAAHRREAIPQGPFGARTPVAPQYLPPDYIPLDARVAQMGEHWADSTSAEFGGAFTRTLIYVSYEGEIIAIEPMITRDHLASRPDEVVEVKPPEAYQHAGHYPTQYRIRYDGATKAYHVVLEGFMERTGSWAR